MLLQRTDYEFWHSFFADALALCLVCCIDFIGVRSGDGSKSFKPLLKRGQLRRANPSIINFLVNKSQIGARLLQLPSQLLQLTFNRHRLGFLKAIKQF